MDGLQLCTARLCVLHCVLLVPAHRDDHAGPEAPRPGGHPGGGPPQPGRHRQVPGQAGQAAGGRAGPGPGRPSNVPSVECCVCNLLPKLCFGFFVDI